MVLAVPFCTSATYEPGGGGSKGILHTIAVTNDHYSIFNSQLIEHWALRIAYLSLRPCCWNES